MGSHSNDGLMDLMEGAKNLVVNYASVKKGENVCIYGDATSDPLVIEAIARAAREAGGEAVIVISSELNDPEETALIDPPRIVRSAFNGSDIVLSIVSVFKMQWSTPSIAKALKEHGVRFAYIGPNTRDELALEWARFPAELAFAIGKTILRDLREGGSQILITDDRGTHLEARVEPTAWSGAGLKGPLNKPGDFGVLPASTIGTTQIAEVNGRVFVDFLESFGPTQEICEWVVKDRCVTDIKGGDQAKRFKEKIFKIKNADRVSQISWGFNPKGRVQKYLQPPWDRNRMSALTRFAGVMHLGLGLTAFQQGGESKLTGNFHTHGVLLRPTLDSGTRPIVDKGRIVALDDPEIRQLAATYGDPRTLLAQGLEK